MISFEYKPCRRCGCTLRYVSNKGCVECTKHRNKQTDAAQSRKKYRNSTKGQETRKKYKSTHKEPYDVERSKNRWLKIQYGITLEQYKQLMSEQHGQCAICSRTSGKRKLAVDHDHKSNKVRGLLCHTCNSALGLFYENVSFLQNAISYLQR